jgi:hypothetical protein
MAVAAQVGCSWCLDNNYFLAQHQNLDLAKASQIPRWRESGLFTPLEQAVLAYAEAMTATPPTVTDDMAAGLLERLGPAALVELAVYVGSAADAEDALQESWLRWAAGTRAQVVNPRAYLIRVVTRQAQPPADAGDRDADRAADARAGRTSRLRPPRGFRAALQ